MVGTPSKHTRLAVLASAVVFLWGVPVLAQETVVVRVKLIQGEVPTDSMVQIWNTIPMRFCQCNCGDIGNSVAGSVFQICAIGSVGPSPSLRFTRTTTVSCARTGTPHKKTTAEARTASRVCLEGVPTIAYSHVRGLWPEPAYSAMMIFQIQSSGSSTSQRGMADFHGWPSTFSPTPPFLMRQNR